MTPAEKARALLDTHHGLGASKRELGAHIVAYERVVPALLDAIEAQRAAGGCARDQRTTQFCAEAVAKDAEIARLTSELAAAKAERVPVVEWADTLDGYKAEKGDFTLTVGPDGWWLSILDRRGVDAWIEGGNETGPAGKSACEAAYRRACGFPAQTGPTATECLLNGLKAAMDAAGGTP